MIGMAMLLAVQGPAAAAPDAAAIALGTQLAQTGMLSALLPMIEAKDTAELLAAHPELSAVERDELARTAKATAAAAKATLYAAMGREYAAALTPVEMRAMIAFNTGPLASRYRAAEPSVIAAAMQAMDGADFKRDTLAAFCAKTGKGCGRQDLRERSH